MYSQVFTGDKTVSANNQNNIILYSYLDTLKFIGFKILNNQLDLKAKIFSQIIV